MKAWEFWERSRERSIFFPPTGWFPLVQCFSSFNGHTNNLGILLRWRFWPSGSGVGLPGDPQAARPHFEKQTLISSGLRPTLSEVAGLSLRAPSRARTPWHPFVSLAKQLSAGLFTSSHYHQGKRIRRHATSCLQRASEKLEVQV